jgi:hypothetical protein
MGTTYLDKATFLEYIEGMKAVYRAEKYHLLDFNCKHYTRLYELPSDASSRQATRSQTMYLDS